MPSPHVLATAVTIWIVLFGPGVVVARLLGLRGVAAWGVAPALTCSLVGVGGLVAAQLGFRWGSWVLVAGTIVAGGLARLLGRSLGPELGAGVRRATGRGGGALVGVLAGGLLIAVASLRAMGSVQAVPAQPDATYHLNAIRHMLASGDISSRDGGGFLYGRSHSFYPSTFHGLAATAGMVIHAQPVVLANLLALATGTTVWTGGCVLLARQVFGRQRTAVVLAGLAAAGFTAMPYLIAGYGPLWPLLLGLALLPSLLAAAVSLLGRARDDVIGRPRAIVVLVVAVVGLPLVHPDALAGLVLLGYVMVGTVALQSRRVVVAALALVVPPVIWIAVLQLPRAKAMTHAYAVGPVESGGRAVGEAVLNNPRFGAPLWVTSALVLLGLVVCVRRRRLRWLAATYVVSALVFIGVAAVQSRFTQGLTVFWYNDVPRLAALVPVVGAPLATVGLIALVRWLQVHSAARPRSATVAVGLTFVILTATLTADAQVGRLRPYYQPRDASTALLTDQEASALETLARAVPRDAIVAGNPWRGHALLYAFGSRAVAFYSEKAVTTPDRQVVADRLAQAAGPDGSAICAAVRRLGVTYVLTGGTNQLPNRAGRDAFVGIDSVPGQPGFEQVAAAAPYTLWRITACG